jgi:hypothetical protein
MCWDHGGGGNSSQPSNSSSPDYDHWMQSLACLMVIPKKTTLRSVLIFKKTEGGKTDCCRCDLPGSAS